MSKVAASGLLRWRLVAQACSGGGHWLRPVPAEVPGLGPDLQRSLAQDCSLGGPCLAHAWSCRSLLVRPAPSAVALL